MKATLGTFAALLLAGAIYAQPAHAQRAPQGSYLDSCTNVGMAGDRLLADCRRMDGTWRRTALDVNGCRGDIANINGRLTCGGGSREGYGSSYRDWREGYGPSRGAVCSGITDPFERERCWRDR